MLRLHSSKGDAQASVRGQRVMLPLLFQCLEHKYYEAQLKEYNITQQFYPCSEMVILWPAGRAHPAPAVPVHGGRLL